MYKKYKVVVACALVVVLSGAFLLYKKNVLRVPDEAPTQQQVTQSAPHVDFTQWATYHDTNYNFRIDHPAELGPGNFSDDEFYIIGFGGTGGPFDYGPLSISIEPVKFHTVDEWLAWQNTKLDSEVLKVSDRITVGGHEAIVTHIYPKFAHIEKMPPPELVYFIKNGSLFSIVLWDYVSSIGENKKYILSSFRFTE